jgi:acyl carrier protein
MNTIDVLREFINDKVPTVNLGSIKPESKFDELGIDSLDLIDLLFEVETRLDIKLGNDFQEIKTVQDLITKIETIKAAHHGN